jgi:metal-sulfur cluster biosynthetic enzyme
VIGQAQVLSALGTVYDPELDEPITDLGFVGSCVVTPDGDVDVRLRLPTPQCAPNFAFLMAADARSAVRRLPGVREVGVVLEDHYTGDEINAAVGRGGCFADAFPGETEDSLDALRELFQRKALVARQARVCQALLARGLTTPRSSPSGWPTCRTGSTPSAASSCAGSSACRTDPVPPRSSRATAPRSRPKTLTAGCAERGS